MEKEDKVSSDINADNILEGIQSLIDWYKEQNEVLENGN